MLYKQSQVTFFVIIGILILLTFSILFFLESDFIKPAENDLQSIFSFGLDVTPIEQYILNCLKNVTLQAIENISTQGGYYHLDTIASTNFSLYHTAYYFYEDKNLMPNKQRVEKEIEIYIFDHIFSCIDQFKVFKEWGFNISFDYVQSLVKLNPNEIVVSMNMPTEISKESQKKELKQFLLYLKDIRLGSMLDTASALIDRQLLESDYIPLSYIYSIAEENDFLIRIKNVEDSNIYFFIILDNSTQTIRKLVYANRYKEYSCDTLPYDTDSSVILDCMQQKIDKTGYIFYLKNIPDMDAPIGREFYYKVNASGLNITFSDSTNLFDIDKTTGVINFTPTVKEIGQHLIWITVLDSIGKEDLSSFYLNITNITRP